MPTSPGILQSLKVLDASKCVITNGVATHQIGIKYAILDYFLNERTMTTTKLIINEI